jgi:hypothetical protein
VGAACHHTVFNSDTLHLMLTLDSSYLYIARPHLQSPHPLSQCV